MPRKQFEEATEEVAEEVVEEAEEEVAEEVVEEATEEVTEEVVEEATENILPAPGSSKSCYDCRKSECCF